MVLEHIVVQGWRWTSRHALTYISSGLASLCAWCCRVMTFRWVTTEETSPPLLNSRGQRRGSGHICCAYTHRLPASMWSHNLLLILHADKSWLSIIPCLQCDLQYTGYRSQTVNHPSLQALLSNPTDYTARNAVSWRSTGGSRGW